MKWDVFPFLHDTSNGSPSCKISRYNIVKTAIIHFLYAIWHFTPLSNFLLETFMPNLVTPTRPSLQILHKTLTKACPISGFLVESLINKICHNFKTSNEIRMKLELVTKRDKKKTTTLKRNWRWHLVKKLWCHRQFSNLWLI